MWPRRRLDRAVAAMERRKNQRRCAGYRERMAGRRRDRSGSGSGQVAAAHLIRDLLPTADNLSHALDSLPADPPTDHDTVQQLRTGIVATERVLQAWAQRLQGAGLAHATTLGLNPRRPNGRLRVIESPAAS